MTSPLRDTGRVGRCTPISKGARNRHIRDDLARPKTPSAPLPPGRMDNQDWAATPFDQSVRDGR